MLANENLELMNEYEIRALVKNRQVPDNFYKYRDLILNAYSDVEFVEATHKYFLNNEELIPVTSMLHQFQQQADWDMIKSRFAKKNGVDVKTVDRWWTLKNIIATNSGTHVHEYAESLFYHYNCEDDKVIEMFKRQKERGYLLPNSGKELAAVRFWDMIVKAPGIIPLLSETKVYSANIPNIKKYAGTFDLLLYYKNPKTGVDGVIIGDYKTNESLINDYNRSHNGCLLYPFTDMIDEALSHYTLQLAAYQIPIQKELGIPVLGRRIIHLMDDGEYKIIQVPDETERLMTALTTSN